MGRQECLHMLWGPQAGSPPTPDSLHVRKGPGQESHFHLDGRRVLQLQDPSQVGHHGVQPGGGGFLQEGRRGS